MKRYGLIGEKLSHSYSIEIHNLIGEYEYKLYEVSPDKLDAFLSENDLSGFNVTIPYKEAVIPYCRIISERAQAIGSVNTMVKLPDGGYYGDNTDYAGFEALLKKANGHRSGKALVLGSGGACKAVCAVLKNLGIDHHIVSRTGSTNYKNAHLIHSDARLIINTTPVGMYPENLKSPIDLRLFQKVDTVIDLIYNPNKTALILQAEELGINAFGGLTMLVGQAVAAARIWSGKELQPNTEKIESRILETKLNTILIGMPGSGKTTIGRKISAAKGLPFIDLDEEIEKAVGMKITDIFRNKGEEYFRDKESELLEIFSKSSGLVISTGGGVVLREKNRKMIKQNSRVLMVDCPLELLETYGRPLSQTTGVEKLWEERKDLYYSLADDFVSLSGR